MDLIFQSDKALLLSLVLVIGLLGGSLGYVGLYIGTPAFRAWRKSIQQGTEERKAQDERRWQLLKPLFVSGAVTEFGFNLKTGQYERLYIRLTGPNFEARCVEYRGTHAEKGSGSLADTVGDALSSSGTERKDMRRIAIMLLGRLQRDEDVIKTYISVAKNCGYVKTKPSENVTAFRKLA